MTTRSKLTMGFIVVILVGNAVLALAIVQYLGRTWLREVQTRVRVDLNSAWAAYDGHLDSTARYLTGVSLGRALGVALESHDSQTLAQLLQRVYGQGQMDMLTLADPDGYVLYRAHNPTTSGDDLSRNPVVSQAMGGRRIAQGAVILSAEDLSNEGPDLATRAQFELLPTKAAKPTTDLVRSDGMVVGAAVPIVSADGQLLGVLYGGDLLNRRYEFVDQIRDVVFPDEVYQGKPIGTVTVFQDDLRVCTNVKNTDGSRAVGTRLSAVVYDQVLQRGGTWADRAFVVNDWYITAYEPIRDPTGKIIGALYVGLLEAPFSAQFTAIRATFLVIVLVTATGSLVLLFFFTRMLLSPIDHIVQMCRRVIDGDLTARVKVRPRGEMGVLCRAVDAMGEAVAQREDQLKIATQHQIGRTERLASIGRLAAGIAHEINNPLTSVLTFSHLLREQPHLNEQDKKDLDLVIGETTRAAEIVRGLLDFARERPPSKELLDVNDVVAQTMALLRSHKQFKQIVIAQQLTPDLPPVSGDPHQLKQVLLNLALNACEAMPEGGRLTISTFNENGEVSFSVADTGVGIEEKDLDRIFDPFFTTKPLGKGTGLGLSVSYGIIEQHAGRWKVDSQVGVGTTFVVTLPAVGRDG